MLVLLLSVGFQMKIMEEMAFSLSFLSRDKEAWRRSELLTAPPISPCFTMGGLTVGAGEPCSESKKAKQGGSVPGVEGKQDHGTLGWALWGLGEETHAGRPGSHVRIILPPPSHFSNGHKFKETKHFFFFLFSPFHTKNRGAI